MIKIEKLNPFGRMCLSMGMIPSSYKESLTYEEQLIWFCNFLENEVIPAVNTNGEAVEELQNLYIELKSYVDNYFDNLDVQTEINNKLDEMVEQGTLQEIIASYLNSKAIFGFDNVNSMKNATNLIDGSYAKTLGYYSKNDGGNALYKIRNITNEDVVDEGSIIALNDENLIAELIFNKSITPEQVGAKGNNIDDDSSYLELAFNLAKNKNINLVLNKEYYINSIINLDGEDKKICIKEDTGFLRIDGKITLHHLTFSEINFKLYSGGNDTINEFGIIFENLFRCNLNLQASNVNKTAFYIHTQGSNPYTASKFCTVIVNGNQNLRTLLHGCDNENHRGVAFGSYIDIEDTNFTYPIRFQNCADVNIIHYENFINDNSFTKNSLEFINAGIRGSLLCLGGTCKNLLYIENASLSADYILVMNEQTGASVSSDLLCTGIYIKGESTFSVNHIASTKLLYTIDAHEMTNQSLLTVGSTYIRYSSPAGRGIYVPDVCNNKLVTSINFDNRIKEINVTTTNEHVDISNVKVEKLQNQIHVCGYITIDSDIAYNSALFTIGGNENIASHISYGFLRQSANNILMCKISQNSNIFNNLNPITLTSGTVLYIDMTYTTVYN